MTVNPFGLPLPKSKAQVEADRKREMQAALAKKLRRWAECCQKGREQAIEQHRMMQAAMQQAGLMPQAPTAKPKRKPRRGRR